MLLQTGETLRERSVGVHQYLCSDFNTTLISHKVFDDEISFLQRPDYILVARPVSFKLELLDLTAKVSWRGVKGRTPRAN